MDLADRDRFFALLLRLGKLFRPPASLQDLREEYWRVLSKLSFSAVHAGAEDWIDMESTFPKPNQWAQASRTHRESDEPTLTLEERREWLAAEQVRWNGSPCSCGECVQAGVADRPRRFVPYENSNGRDVYAWLDDRHSRRVSTGYWIHGYALARWYKARADFYENAAARGWTRLTSQIPLP